MENHKLFNSQEFVGRDKEIALVREAVRERKKNVIVFEGDRGVGKTSLLLNLFKLLSAEGPGVKPFFLSLFPYRADEFADWKNIWIREEKFNPAQITELLDQIASYFEMIRVTTNDPDTQKEYLARGLAHLPNENMPVLFVDAIYECEPGLREQLEKYILLPFISSERSLLILSGRGSVPAWSHPALRFANVQRLQPFEEETWVRLQLEKLVNPGPYQAVYKEIAEYSARYPLLIRLLGQAQGTPQDELDGAIDILLSETLLTETFVADFSVEERKQIRLYVEKLSLVTLPFRKLEVENYIFDENPSGERPAKMTTLIETLLRSHIMCYENGGYQLNESIAKPIRRYLTLPRQEQKLKYYKTLLDKNYHQLAEKYQAASSRYNNLISELSLIQTH
jgi:hypothetical protein